MALQPDILTHLETKRTEVASARRRLELMEAELRGAEGLARLLVGHPEVNLTLSDKLSAGERSRPTEHIDDGSSSDGRRGFSNQWKKLLEGTLDTYPDDLSLDDLEALSERLGHTANRNTLRSQMSIYTEQGFVERTGKGRYRLTQKGASAIGVSFPALFKEAAPEPSQDVILTPSYVPPGPSGFDDPDSGDARDKRLEAMMR